MGKIRTSKNILRNKNLRKKSLKKKLLGGASIVEEQTYQHQFESLLEIFDTLKIFGLN